MQVTTINTTTKPQRLNAEIIQFPHRSRHLTEEEYLAQDRALAARIDAVRELFEAHYAAEAALVAATSPATILQFPSRRDFADSANKRRART